MIQLEKLFKAGVHFGHQKRRWCPKMEPYIWGFKNNVHLIDISKTAYQLDKAATFLKELAGQGKSILWIGTKKSAQEAIEDAANQVDTPYVNHRWIGGTLSNFAQVKKSVTKYLHYKDVLAKADKFPHYTKKELNVISKAADRLQETVGGILNLKWPVGAVVIVDVNKERSALREAIAMDIPVVALVDTNADPTNIDYVIPTNDDSPRAVKVILDYLADAVQAGKDAYEEQREKERLQKEQEREEAKAKKEKEHESKKTAKKETSEKGAPTEKTEKKDAQAAELKKTTKKAAPAKKTEDTSTAKKAAPVKKTAAKKTTTTKKETSEKKESSATSSKDTKAKTTGTKESK